MSEKQKIIIDACVLVDAMDAEMNPSSANLQQTQAQTCVSHAFEKFDVCFTRETLMEFAHVAIDMDGSRGTDSMKIRERMSHVDSLQDRSKQVKPGLLARHCSHKKDNEILRAASGAQAAYIISNDKHLWSMGRVGDAIILTPEQYNCTVFMGIEPEELETDLDERNPNRSFNKKAQKINHHDHHAKPGRRGLKIAG